MTGQIWRDAAAKPHLFRWTGAFDQQELLSWLRRREAAVPGDLFEFWVTAGGGEIFESEMLLHPLDKPLDEDSVDWAERYHRGRGMPEGHLPFHEGACGLSVVRLDGGAYLNLDRQGYGQRGSYDTFDHWYCRVVREEFAERYGLPSLIEG